MLSAAGTLGIRGRKRPDNQGGVHVSRFVGGLGRLTQRLAELEDCDLAVSIVQMEKGVHLVARSMRPELNLLEILDELGVKGHAGAVTLTVKGSCPEELKQRVIGILEQRLPQGHGCRRPDVGPGQIGGRQRHRGGCPPPIAPVWPYRDAGGGRQRDAGGELCSRRDIEKAMRHDLGHAPVRGAYDQERNHCGPGYEHRRSDQDTGQNDIGRVPVLDRGQTGGHHNPDRCAAPHPRGQHPALAQAAVFPERLSPGPSATTSPSSLT